MNTSKTQLMVFTLTGLIAKNKTKILHARENNKQMDTENIRHVQNLMNALKLLRACRDYDDKNSTKN